MMRFLSKMFLSTSDVLEMVGKLLGEADRLKIEYTARKGVCFAVQRLAEELQSKKIIGEDVVLQVRSRLDEWFHASEPPK